MDPLSIGSAVIGLIAGTSRIAPLLHHFIVHTRNAPKTASQILDELNSIAAALQQLQTYVLNAAGAPSARRSMLSLNNIIATLTACVTTYSDLDSVVQKCLDKHGSVRRAKWIINETEIVELVQRVQAHKSSLTLMLTILQWYLANALSSIEMLTKVLINRRSDSIQEATNSMHHLVEMVGDLVASNAVIRARMDALANEQESDLQPSATTDDELESMASPQASTTFETDLDTSRVYRKLRLRPSLWSLSTGQQGSMALTAFSELTMDDVSNLSVLRLPIWSNDLFNANCYDFEIHEATPRDSPTMKPSDTPVNNILRSPRGKSASRVFDWVDVPGNLAKARLATSTPGYNVMQPRDADAGRHTTIDSVLSQGATTAKPHLPPVYFSAAGFRARLRDPNSSSGRGRR
jgi:hypothetical protein